MSTETLMGIHNHGISAIHPYSQSNILGQVESHLEPLVGFRVLNVGGNANTDWSNAVQYGLSYANANNDTSNSNDNLGSRLNFVNS